MFEAGIPLATSPELREAGERAFAVLRGASETLRANAAAASAPSLDGRSALGDVLAVRPWRPAQPVERGQRPRAAIVPCLLKHNREPLKSAQRNAGEKFIAVAEMAIGRGRGSRPPTARPRQR
jgi:hypothetical protein